MITNHEEIQEFLNDSDWPYLFELGGDFTPSKWNTRPHNEPAISPALGSDAKPDPVLRADVVCIFASHEDRSGGYAEWDGQIVVELKDGRFAFLTGGCDTTGWDCRSGGHVIVAESLEHLVRFGLGEYERARLGLSC